MTTTEAPPARPLRRSEPAPFRAAGDARSRVGVLRHQRPRIAFALLVSAQFVVMLDTSIVNVALPSIQSDLGLSPAALTWVVNTYVLAFGGLLLLSGRAADLFGRRRMFMAGSFLFTVGTLLAAAAGNEWMLLAGRIIQGAGAAALSPAAMSLLLLTFQGQARAKAMSIWGAASGAGGATGVFVGGTLTGAFGWSSVFLVTVPVSFASVLLARRVLDEPGTVVRHRFDWAGAATVTGAVIALVHACFGAAADDWTSPEVVAGFPCFVVLTAAFIFIERRVAEPLVPLDLFASRILSTGVTLALLGGAARASSFVLVALYLQQALHLAPREAGLAMLPTSLAGVAVSLVLLARVVRFLGPQRTLVVGLVVLAAGHIWLAYAPRHAGYLVAVLPGLLLLATGVALSFTPTTMVIAAAVPDTHTGLASGMAGSASQVGAALGTATFIAIGMAASGPSTVVLRPSGFTAAFTAAALVSLVTAALGCTIASQGSPGPLDTPAAVR
ncbi:MAG: transporter [Nocardioides sp.]|uniref:MFS transporter n=1 Tax=Nocardioides sp. TaxID=35761 RepID=UPI0026027305|nr:MFS transporter [Nocardioides sp.]MCW2834631.1 transporter [Nocardioides sp.]